MTREENIIKLINSVLPQGKSRLNSPMECDSEILKLNGDLRILFTTDEFSEEDKFNDADPYGLGWNIAAGSISDILAAGGEPRYYGHAMTTSQDWNEKYIKQFARGIADVLKAYDTEFIGGDLGTSKSWRYTSSVIGSLPGKALTRMGAKEGHSIYITGKVGTGNLNAALNIYGNHPALKTLLQAFSIRLILRRREAALVRKFASTCIDTSDGVLNALNTIADLNLTGYEVVQVPYLKKGLAAAKILSLPPIMLIAGECGEYELLFTISPEAEPEFKIESDDMGLTFHRLGTVTNGPRTLKEKGKSYSMENLILRARDYSDPKEYLRAMIKHLEQEGFHV